LLRRRAKSPSPPVTFQPFGCLHFQTQGFRCLVPACAIAAEHKPAHRPLHRNSGASARAESRDKGLRGRIGKSPKVLPVYCHRCGWPPVLSREYAGTRLVRPPACARKTSSVALLLRYTTRRKSGFRLPSTTARSGRIIIFRFGTLISESFMSAGTESSWVVPNLFRAMCQ